MKSLHTLLKVAQRRMDEIGIEAACITLEIDELRGKQGALRAREQAEIATASTNPMFGSILPAYRMRVKAQIGEIQVQVISKEEALAEVRERLSTAYIEKSKFEQLIEQEAIRLAAERASKEQAMLDEVAINRAGSAGK
jgi:flagellar export protein FliJ